MKNIGTALLISFLMVLVYDLFFAPKPADQPEPQKPQQVEVQPVILTLLQQNSAPNYQIVLDSVPAEAPAGWKVVSTGRSGDIVNIEK